jgi:hypothetical protein
MTTRAPIVVFHVTDYNELDEWHEFKRDALSSAAAHAQDGGKFAGTVHVRRITIPRVAPRTLACMCLRGSGFALDQTDIASFEPKGAT